VSLSPSIASGVNVISYAVSGMNAVAYAVPPNGTLSSAAQGMFALPVYPTLIAGETSVPLNVSISVLPLHTVTVTPFGRDLTFDPPQFNFSSGFGSLNSSVTPFDLPPFNFSGGFGTLNSSVARVFGLTFTVFVSPSAPNGIVPISYVLSDSNSVAYVTPTNGSLTTTARRTFAPPAYPALIAGETSVLLTMTVDELPIKNSVHYHPIKNHSNFLKCIITVLILI
jgi:hypothetical protein